MSELQDGVTIDLSSVQVERKPRRRKKVNGTGEQFEQHASPSSEPIQVETGEVASDETARAAFALLIPALYSVIGKVEAWFASRATGFPMSVTTTVFEYTPEEIAILQDPTATVLAKYAGGLTKFSDELTLAFILLSVNEAKFRKLQEAKNERSDIRQEASGEIDAKPISSVVS